MRLKILNMNHNSHQNLFEAATNKEVDVFNCSVSWPDDYHGDVDDGIDHGIADDDEDGGGGGGYGGG